MIPTRHLETEIFIPAPPLAVWAVLADGDRFAEWNPFILSMTGTLGRGARLTTVIQPKGSRPMTFRPTVLVADPGRELRWLGRLGLPGLFDGEHAFRLLPRNGGTRLLHSETFRGVLLWVMNTDRFCADFMAMNDALKARVAQSA